MKNSTESILLSQPVAAESEISIRSFKGITATDSFMPEQATQPSAENPEPVSGDAEELASYPRLVEKMNDPVINPTERMAPPELEVVIGEDDRKKVPNPEAHPYRVHGHMLMTFPNGKRYIGSGTLVNRRHVLTAGHCVYSSKDGGWATTVLFNAAQTGSNYPFGNTSALNLLSVSGWTQDNDSNYDYAMLILDQDLGNETGWMGIVAFDSDTELIKKRVNVTGYPGDLDDGRVMYTHADIIKSVARERFLYDIDTYGGQSGSGVWSVFPGHEGEKVCGVHTTGSYSGNGAVRISKAKLETIVRWLQDY